MKKLFHSDMEHLNAAAAQASSSLYGVSMAEYGDVGVSSMMALMTQHEPHERDSILTTSMPSSFSSFHGHAECLLSAAMFQASQGDHKLKRQPEMDQLVSEQAVMSDSSMPSVKTEGCSSLRNQFEIRREQTGNCYTDQSSNAPVSPLVTSLVPQAGGEARMITSLEADSSHFSGGNEAEAIKAKILAHPQYPSLLGAYIDCQKIGAPPEVVARLDALTHEYENQQHRTTVSIGMDPELDQFMEAYCEMLTKYHEELTKPFKEAMSFLKKIEAQLNSLSKGTIRISPSAENDEKTEGGASSEEVEDGSGGETDFQEVDHHAVEDRELKDHLLRKYSGYLSSLKQEFMKKKKKGKLPKDARQKLLDWWTVHYKWPYPSETEKIALAECTGLDQKQINNWFINQRKRHWKPSGDMQLMAMDGQSPHGATLYVERHLMTEGYHLDC
jgi:hypothetical protein